MAISEQFTLASAQSLLKPEADDTYKNRRGHVLVVGGSFEYSGAPFLAGEAALRTGAGLCTVAIPQGMPIYCQIPRALMIRQIANRSSGHFDHYSINELIALAEKASAIAIGPGLSKHPGVEAILSSLFQLPCPKVLDADALNLLADFPYLTEKLSGPVIITPHLGEFSRLAKAFGIEEKTALSDQAMALAKKLNCIVVLKGHPTLVVNSATEIISENTSGCPVLATAGSGDCLTGIIAGLLANGEAIYDAARLGVYIHGLCGDLLSTNGNTRGHIADDLLPALPKVFEYITTEAVNR